jgi:hypothetical protein
MNAAFMQYGPVRERAGVMEVRFRCALRPMATRGRTKIKNTLTGIAP